MSDTLSEFSEDDWIWICSNVNSRQWERSIIFDREMRKHPIIVPEGYEITVIEDKTEDV